MKPGLFNLPELRQGDTYSQIVIVNGLRYSDGTPLPIASAQLQVRDLYDNLILSWISPDSCTITGANTNVVTLNSLTSSQTENLPSGSHSYDLQVQLQTGEVWTLLQGVLPITQDVTQ